ncbi:MAG TPA: ABC transporter permease [Gemmatirosa sp.]|nr:ABC transporter permease [Gemmatirosa sp.]
MTGRPPGVRRAFRLPSAARRAAGEVDEEIAFHLVMREERLRARGLAPDDARDAARRRFGDVEHVRRECLAIDRQLVRRQHVWTYLEDLMKDVVLALRVLRRAPGFAAAALLTLALGIGAATAIFSVAYGVLLRPLPFPAPERLAQVHINLAGTGVGYGSLSAPEYVDLTRETRSFGALAAWTGNERTIGGDGPPERVTTASATASLFGALGVRAAVGRTFVAEEDVPGGAPVVVLTDALWRRRFGGDPAAVGRTVQLDGVARTVVGVLPAGVRVGSAEAFIPLALDPGKLPGRGAHYLRVLGRLRPGVTLDQARAELATFAERTTREHATNYRAGGFTASARPLREAWYGEARPLMLALLGTVALLLLLAAVNVANLLLVRAEARQREMGVRVARGASRWRLVWQLLTESLLLASLGALIGVPLAVLGVRALLAINPGVVPPGAEVTIDGWMLVGAVGIVALAALVAGVAPASGAGSTDVRTVIAAGSAGGGRRGGRLRATLVATEVALAAAMLAGAGLVGRSFQKLLAVDPGFSAESALVMDIALPRARYDTSTKVVAFYDQAVERLKALPGVRTAAATATLPLAGGTVQWSVELEGRPNSVHELTTPYIVSATTDVFRALGVSIVRGRGFGPDDTEGAMPVTVVSEALAREFWPGEDAIGKRISLSGESTWMTIVGVARDVRPEALSEPPRPTYYVPTPQFARMVGFADHGMTLVMRTAGDPSALVGPARAAIRELDPTLALDDVQTLEAVVAESVSRPRFAALVLGAFGVSALVLAVVGVYGVLSYATTRRRRELAVRMALGARPRAVRQLVLGSGLRLAAAGIAVGLVAAVVGGRVLTTLLYEVSPTDPATLLAVGVTLVGAAAAASWVPARRATRVSPAEVLRGD